MDNKFLGNIGLLLPGEGMYLAVTCPKCQKIDGISQYDSLGGIWTCPYCSEVVVYADGNIVEHGWRAKLVKKLPVWATILPILSLFPLFALVGFVLMPFRAIASWVSEYRWRREISRSIPHVSHSEIQEARDRIERREQIGSL